MCLIRAAEPITAKIHLLGYIRSDKKKTLQLPFFPPETGEASEVPLKATALTSVAQAARPMS
jgi:hypothetical protein